MLLPQHEMLPFSRTAQVCPEPADTAVASLIFVTDTGSAEVNEKKFIPAPSWAVSLAPQQETPPFSCNTQVCQSPELTLMASLMFGTFIGSAESKALPISPVPSSPRQLSPQQETSPVVWTAQVCSPPAETSIASEILRFQLVENILVLSIPPVKFLAGVITGAVS